MQPYEGPHCNLCGIKACSFEPGTREYPPFCPMPVEVNLLSQVSHVYQKDPEILKLTMESARTEAAGYCKATRIEEIMDFARRIGANRIGIAHCIGLMNEARVAGEIFHAGGFQVYAACCKTGSIAKELIGLTDEDKVRPGQYEVLCNPIGQAALLEKAGTQLNVVIGLCVGHDSLFFMHSKAPTTVLVAKDRVLGHNPVACLYTSHSYYQRLKKA